MHRYDLYYNDRKIAIFEETIWYGIMGNGSPFLQGNLEYIGEDYHFLFEHSIGVCIESKYFIYRENDKRVQYCLQRLDKGEFMLVEVGRDTRHEI